jgi:hypothetical protein
MDDIENKNGTSTKTVLLALTMLTTVGLAILIFILEDLVIMQ